ncbi:MAG: pyridoxamine 5'-phosphate oxidase family protein, partial [Deltaproteobacteria bacterium]
MNLASLEEIHQAIWKKLEHAVRHRDSAWHLPVLATVRAGKPELRTLVLRGALPEKNTVWMHTDLRSPKCQDLKNCSAASLLFYDSIDRWQLRLNGTIQLDSNSESTETTWKKVSASAKRCYQGPFVPGTRSEELSYNLPQASVSPDW